MLYKITLIHPTGEVDISYLNLNEMEVFNYQGNAITFDFGDGQKYINATEMGKAFGKRPSKFLELGYIREYIAALEQESDVREAVITVRGKFSDGRPEGTWMHKTLALRFAQWLSPHFAL